jgi:Icc-related predicted phosphoesterase
MLRLWRLAAAGRGMDALVQASQRHAFSLQKEVLARQQPSEDSWCFIVLGDTRNNRRLSRQLYLRDKQEDPVLIFHTGDIVRAGTALELLKNHIAIIEETGLECPVFCVPGNHERGPKRDFAAFKALYGADRFSFQYGECLFVGVNNSAKRGLDQETLQFLESTLSSSARYKFVFLHIPPAFFEERFVSDKRRRGFKKNAEAFHCIMKDHQVNEVFMAHIHGYATALLDGVRYTLTAGGGAPLSRRLAPEDRIHHFLRFVVASDTLERDVITLPR